jgi:hypothetical protein
VIECGNFTYHPPFSSKKSKIIFPVDRVDRV